MQKKLADGNSVSEAALGSMSTVRTFDAADAELKEFEKCMTSYLDLNLRSAVAYCGYAAFTTALPQLVFAVVGTCWTHSIVCFPPNYFFVHLTFFTVCRNSVLWVSILSCH